MKVKQIFSCVMAASLLFSPPMNGNRVYAGDSLSSIAMYSLLTSSLPFFLYNSVQYIEKKEREFMEMTKTKKIHGFRKPKEIIEKLSEIVHNKSEIKIYGQEKAKKQAYSVLCSIVARLDNMACGRIDEKDFCGNIVYLIGPSGTGKTTLAYAIADAFLKCSEKTFFSCSSESISKGTNLGSQLFQTVAVKNIGQMRKLSSAFERDSRIPKEEESPVLKHILRWQDGAVILLDEYDKMKLMTKDSATEVQCDKSADEFMRSIVSQGGYTFMGEWIDCSKILFLVTTNETRSELEANFGIGGIKGGGVQRLNVIEFEELSMDACRRIVDGIIRSVGEALVDTAGLFQLASINIDNDSVENMVRYIFEDKTMQGRAKHVLENKIYSLFSDTIGDDCEKDIKLSCNYSSEEHEIEFTKTVIESCEEGPALSHDFPGEKTPMQGGIAAE